MLDLIEKVEEWAEERNLIDGSDPKSQLLKCMAELGELADGVNKNDIDEIVDGLGDVLVTLIILGMHYNVGLEYALNEAYLEIKDRKGKLTNGVFVKQT